MSAEQVAEHYGPLIVEMLTEVRAELVKRDCGASEPSELHDDEYRWEMTVYEPKSERTLAWYVIEIEEAAAYGESGGINFSLTVTGDDSRILGMWIPWNYTDNVWVEGAANIARRWREFAKVSRVALAWLASDEIPQ